MIKLWLFKMELGGFLQVWNRGSLVIKWREQGCNSLRKTSFYLEMQSSWNFGLWFSVLFTSLNLPLSFCYHPAFITRFVLVWKLHYSERASQNLFVLFLWICVIFILWLWCFCFVMRSRIISWKKTLQICTGQVYTRRCRPCLGCKLLLIPLDSFVQLLFKSGEIIQHI